MINKICNLCKNETLLKGVLFTVYSFINRGFAFLLLILLANYITPAEYGYLSLFNTVIMVMGYFVALSAEGYQSIVYFQEGKEGQRQVISGVSLIVCIFTLLFFITLLISGNIISDKLDLDIYTLFYALIISAFTVFKNMYLDNLRLHEDVKIYGIVSCSNAFLYFSFTLFMVISLNMNWYGQVTANLIVSVLYGGLAVAYFIKNDYLTRHVKHIFKPMLKWSIPLIPHAASSFIRQGCDRYIINEYHTIDDVGLFSFALNMANLIMIIGLGFNSSNSVDIYKTLGDKHLSNKDKKERLVYLRKTFTYIYLGCSCIIAFLGYIFVPLFFPQYTLSKNYFLILMVYGFFQCLYLLWTNYLFYFKKTRNLMIVTFGSSILHLVLSLLLTRYSLYFTVIIYCFTQGVVTLLIRNIAKKELNCQLK